MHEKERISSHALPRRPATGWNEYMKRKCAQLGASSLTCRSFLEMLQYSVGTTCSVDATLIKRPAGWGEVIEWRIGGVEELTHPLSTHPLTNLPLPFSGL